MKSEVVHLVNDIHAPKRRKDQTAAIEKLKATCQNDYDDMIEAISSPEYEQSRAETKWFGPTKKLILNALFQHPTEQLVRDTAHFVDHPDDRVVWEYAHCVSSVGEIYSLDVVGQCLTHSNRSVRAYASYGLRDVAQHGDFNEEFALRAGELLRRYITDYPDEAGHPRFVALEIFDQEAYTALMAASEPHDPIEQLLDTIFAVADKFASHRDALTGFNGFPDGYIQIYALHYVDAEIRNGGIYQLYANSTWCLVLDAIQGCEQFGFDQLADALKGIVYYYHKNGRSKLKRRIPKEFFLAYTPTSTTLPDLEDQYYSAFDRLGSDPLRTAIKNHLEAFN